MDHLMYHRCRYNVKTRREDTTRPTATPTKTINQPLFPNIDEVKTKNINQLFQYGYYQVKIQPTCCCYIRLQVDAWMGVKTPGSVIYQSHISIYHIYVIYVIRG